MKRALMQRSTVTTFWMILSALMMITALVGFWPTYYGPLIAGTLEAQCTTPGLAYKQCFSRPIVHLHGVVFMGWVALFTAQAFLASKGYIALHRKVGKVGIAYGILVVVVGLATTFNELANGIAEGQTEAAQSGLIAPFTNIVVFTIFFSAAIAYRRQTEIHKRFMLLATVMLLIAAVLRMPVNPRLNLYFMPLFLSIWFAPVLLAMIYDYVTRRVIHPVYVIGLVSLTILSLRHLVSNTDLWMSIARQLSTLVS